jgi:hypothetical protein
MGRERFGNKILLLVSLPVQPFEELDKRQRVVTGGVLVFQSGKVGLALGLPPLFRLDPALGVLGTVDDSCPVGCPFVIVSEGLRACAGARCELTRGTTKIKISGLRKCAKRMPLRQRNAGVAAMLHQLGGPVGASVSPVSCRCSLYFRSFRSSITAPGQTVSATSDDVYFRIKLSLRRLCAMALSPNRIPPPSGPQSAF